MSNSSVSRRHFFQITAAGAAAATQIGCGRKPSSMGQRAEIPTTCELCPNKCSVIAVVENGLIRKLNPNPENPKSRGMLCARGNAGLLQVYDPDRLKRPLIRAGERGEGKWREVSWEEAFDYTAARLSAIKEKYGPEGVLWSSTEAFAEVFFKNLGLAFGSPNIVRHPTLGLAAVNLAYSVTFGTVPSFERGYRAERDGVCQVDRSQAERGMADDVRRAEGKSEVLEEDFGESLGGGPENAFRAVLFLDRGKAGGGVVERLLPGDLPPLAFAALTGPDEGPLEP